MSEKSMIELKEEAADLGVDITGLKSKVEVAAAINDYYIKQEGKPVEVKEEPEEEKEAPKEDGGEGLNSNPNRLKALIKRQKEAAFETKVVTITNNDKRDNSVTTTAYLGFENQYFSKSRNIPLDVPIELEVCLIEIAKKSQITQHVDEIINGKRTGNKIPKLVRKYSVSYEDIQVKK